MRLPKITAAAMLAIALALTACSDEVDEAPSNVESPSSSTLPTATATPAVRPTPSAAQQDEDTMSTIVDFTAGDVIVEVTIAEDTPTTRSFLAMLPMTVGFSDHGGKEKVATPDRGMGLHRRRGPRPPGGRPVLVHAVGKPRLLLQRRRQHIRYLPHQDR